MSQPLNIGIIGCGDFLRLQAPALKASKLVKVKSLFDVDTARAERYARELGGEVAVSADAIIADKSIQIACPFVPPWLRKDLLVRAAQAGKHVLTTKPLAASTEDADAIVGAVKDIRCAVIYKRTGDGWVEAVRQILTSGEIGKLALFRQDWNHHYPQWNTWALDVAKNGGPFMDAMIHNLNAARYLMARPMTRATLFSEKLAHPDLTCPDTEMLKADFAGNGSAYLFITWAADLTVRSMDGNFRENIEILYLVTDRGWRMTREQCSAGPAGPAGFQVVASRSGEKRTWPEVQFPQTIFDRFAEAIRTGGPLPSDVGTPQMARDDIALIRNLLKRPGQPTEVNIPA